MPTKILAIDDSKTMRLAIKITFAAEDCEVVAVSKGSEAVARAKQMGADILLVDHRLAGSEPSGYDVCKAMKADPATSSTPVIILCSNQEGIDDAKIRECGADGAITKPFSTQELIDKVKSLAGKPSTVQTVATAPSQRQPRSNPAPVQSPVRQPVRSPAIGSPRQQAAPAASSSSSSGGKIPIAVPIPFTSAGSPTPGILKRLQEAGGGAGGVDPKVLEALVAISRDVIEAVVWEVVPDLAEQIIKEQRAG